VTRGIVILGPPRSGTTLLRRILGAHPDIAAPPETYLLSGAARFLHEDRFSPGLPIGAVAGLGFAGFDEAEVLSRLRAFVFGFADDFARRHDKRRWALKTAFDAFHVPAIRRLCAGHVQFVCLQRQGLDVIASLEELVHKTGGYVDELHAYVRRHPDPLEAFAQAWIDAAGAVAELAADEPGAIALRYEDLVREPAAVIADLLARLGARADEGVLARALAELGEVGFGDWKTYGRATIDDSSVDRWRRLPAAARARLAELCNPTLVRLGYGAVPIDTATDDAQRRYELGLMVQRMRRPTS